MGDVARVSDGELDLAAGQIFEATQEEPLKGSPEEKAEGRALNDMRVDLELHIAYPHREMFRAPDGPTRVTVRAFHRKTTPLVNRCTDFLRQVQPDCDDL
jgi:hypothetical protein